MPRLSAIESGSSLLTLVFHHSDLLVKVLSGGDVHDLHLELFVILDVLTFTLFAFVGRTPFKRPVLGVFLAVVLFPA